MQPDNTVGSADELLRYYIRPQTHWLATLSHVGLIDTNLVNPETTWVVRETESQ